MENNSAHLSREFPSKEWNEVSSIEPCEAFERFSAAYSPFIISQLVSIYCFTLQINKYKLTIHQYFQIHCSIWIARIRRFCCSFSLGT